MTEATPIYRQIMVECERRRQQLGLPMWQVDDLAGTQDGYYAKALWPDTPSGRQAQWASLQLIVTALFPEGFDLEIRPHAAAPVTAAAQRSKVKSAVVHHTPDKKLVREHMSELGKRGAVARMTKIPRWKRRLMARKAGRASARARRTKRAALQAKSEMSEPIARSS